jgi:hypothetical protein
VHLLGEVVLRDLKLKREALDKLNLPVDVLEGKNCLKEKIEERDGRVDRHFRLL